MTFVLILYFIALMSLGSYVWTHRTRNFLMITHPSKGLQQLLMIFAVLFWLVGLLVLITIFNQTTVLLITSLVIGAFLAMIFGLIVGKVS